MNVSNPISLFQNTDSETVTLIALPFQLFQQTNQNSLLVDQNILFKTIPEGTLVIDTNQLINNNSNNISVTQETNCTNEQNVNNTEPTVFTSLPAKAAEKNIFNNDDKNKSKIRYLNSKTSVDVRKVGRPKRDGTKPETSDKNETFQCKYCAKKFQKYLLYKRHEKSHMNEKKYKCTACSASFNILSNHILHLAVHNTKDPTCPECGKKFQRIASLKAHMMYHEKEENFYCEDCDVLFNNEVEMTEHIKEHGQEKKEETDNLQCKYCQLTFKSQPEYKKHMNEHNKVRNILQTSPRKKSRKSASIERKHQCTICSKAFQKLSQIERHMRVHSGEKPYICKICNRGFSQKGSLQIHMTKHTGIRPHKCALCQAKFSQKGNLRAHILKTHSIPHGGENVFSCTECSCVFKRLGSLNGHMTRNHPKEKNGDIKYVISQLTALQNNTSVNNDILQEAILKSDLPEVQNNDKDDTPTATYVTLTDLSLDGNMRRYLIKQRKVGDIRWHLCSFCPKEFKKPSDLVRHLRVHTREKPYVCKICLKSFAVKSTLTTHFKTHAKCTKVQCTYCYKFFSSWTSLNAHKLKHTGQKYKCSVCNKFYRSLNKLNQHFQIHLNNENHSSYYKEPNSNVVMLQPIQITNKGLQPVLSIRKRPLTEAGCRTRPYSCNICGAAFRRLSHLKQHHIKHTGERPFQCHLCFRNFASNSILKTHILTHNGAKPYKCVVCQKNFSTNGSLKRHLESHSNAKPFLCPYCFKDFKNILQCRKHIQSHNLDLNLELDANEHLTNSELIEKSNELQFPSDLADTLVDEPFSLVDPLNDKDTSEKEQIDETPLVTHTLRADENGTVVLPVIANQENLTQENIREIEDTLNSQMLNIIGNENFVDSSTYVNKLNASEPIATTDELVNTLSSNTDTEKTIEDNPFLYHQVIVNLNPENEQMPIFDNNGIDNILSQVKLQNDSLFLTDINSLNINNINETNNVLLPFQIAPQTDLQQNQLIMLPSEIEQDIQNNTLNPPVNIDDMNQNLQLKLNVMNGFLNQSQNIPETNIVLNEQPINNPEDYLNSEENIETVENENQSTLSLDTISKPVFCNLCKLQFKTKNDLKVHQCLNFINVKIKSTNKLESDSPKEAKSEFLSKEKIDPLNVNSQVYKNICSYCSKSFRKPSDLQRHIRTHTGERPFKCDECAKSFSLKSTLESHSKIHQGRKEITCHVCNCLFATKGSLSVHMRLHTGVKPFKCPLCQLKFRTSGHRKAHLTVHYKEAFRTGKIPADIVTRKAKMVEFLDGVQNILDSDLSDKKKKVDDSSLELVNISLQTEMNVTQPVDNNIVLQSDEKPLMHFEIETNNQGQIINIKPTASNILFVDETSKEEIVSTQVEFDEKTRLQIEEFLREKKAKQLEVKNRVKKVCNVCQKEFNTKYLLDRHSKIHTGEKIFSCNYCSKTFNQKNALEAHVRTHLGTRPFECPFCWNTFNQSGNLKTHIKRIHDGKTDKVHEKKNIASDYIGKEIAQTDI